MSPVAPKLSCEQCCRRKTKCDKSSPCSACKIAEINCTPVRRARLPRGRTANHKKTDLSSRVAHLEHLLEQLKGQVRLSSNTADESEDCAASNPLSSDHPHTFNQFVASDFLVALSQGVAGLRNTLEQPAENTCSPKKAHIGLNLNAGRRNTSNDILSNLSSPSSDDGVLPIPSEETQRRLLDIYQQRVDPLFKVTHWFTVSANIKKQYKNSRYTPSSPSMQVLEFSIYLLAICSISDVESRSILLAERKLLLKEYRRAAEIAMAKANLLQRPDIVALQGFVIYLLAICLCMDYATAWSLLAVAVRLASALGLPADDEKDQSVDDVEMSRRLWFGIGMLDTQTSIHRGCATLLSLRELTSPPLAISDLQLCTNSVTHRCPPFNHMSFSYVINEATIAFRKLCAPPAGSEDSWSDWNSKLTVVNAFEKSMEEHCARFHDSPDALARFTQFVSEDIGLNMQVLLRRPPYRRKDSPVPPWDEFDVLIRTTEVLEHALRKLNDGIFAPWAWFSRCWVKSYALAILLAELCIRPEGNSANRAYAVAKEFYMEHAELHSETDRGTLWKSISKLMRRVHRARGELSSDLDTLIARVLKTSSSTASTTKTGQTVVITPPACNQSPGSDWRPTAAPSSRPCANEKVKRPADSMYMGFPEDQSHPPSFQDGIRPEGSISWLNWDNLLIEMNGFHGGLPLL